MTQTEAGFIILCDSAGLILEVLADHTGLLDAYKPGQPLALFFDSSSVDKALQFMQAIRKNQAAFDWELDIRDQDRLVTMFFAGVLFEEKLLIMASVSRSKVVLSFYEEIMRISHEQNNQLRSMLKSASLGQPGPPPGSSAVDEALYHEFTQINNRLVNMQREVAKRNTQIQMEYERQRMISELMSDYAFAIKVDESGGLQLDWITEAYTRITGYDTGAPAADPEGCFTRLYPGAESVARQHLESGLSGEADKRELRIITRDGEQRYLQVSCRPIRDEKTGRVIRLYGAAHDITQHVLAEQQARALELERERSAILANFIQDALHEFHTPLTIIKTQLYLMNRAATDSKEQQSLRQLENQADAIQGLVNALAMMARLDQEESTTKRAVIQPGSLVSEVCQLLAGDAQVGQVSLIVSPQPDLPAIHANTQDLALAVNAVVSNAIRYTPPGGTVRVTTSQRQNDVLITVSDSGIGIAAEDMPHIFERFWRADKARTQRGFGLGLPIACRIVENHYGRIEVHSTPGEGSTFSLILPIHTFTAP